jgi:hypothetical protein
MLSYCLELFHYPCGYAICLLEVRFWDRFSFNKELYHAMVQFHLQQPGIIKLYIYRKNLYFSCTNKIIMRVNCMQNVTKYYIVYYNIITLSLSIKDIGQTAVCSSGLRWINVLAQCWANVVNILGLRWTTVDTEHWTNNDFFVGS